MEKKILDHVASDSLDVELLLKMLIAYKNGDFTVRLPNNITGLSGKVADTLNEIIAMNENRVHELDRIRDVVGLQGILNQRIDLTGSGGWKAMGNTINALIQELTLPTKEITRVISAVAKGDLSQTVSLEFEGKKLQGDFLKFASIVNTMVEQLNSFSNEVTRVAREVGTDGKLGGQARVRGVDGTWKDLTDSVNSMASNLTNQVRNISDVTIAVARGDLSRKITVDVRGDFLLLKETINSMVDQLSSFASEVTRVAREVGTEGRLGGQATVPGALGIWRDLTDNVNQLASNLTTQVRAIAKVATAVTKGDLTRSIQVDAKGEVEELKNNLNEMIRNLREMILTNSQQDWLKTNIARITRMLQGQHSLQAVAQITLSELAPLINAQHGLFFVVEDNEKGEADLKMFSSYAFKNYKNRSITFSFGEGIVGQCALEKRQILINHVPTNYIMISSGLGEAPPQSIIAFPIIFEGNVKAVIELASFEIFRDIHLTFLDQLADTLGIIINTIESGSRTENLLIQSQSLAQKLQTQQQELQQTNEQLKGKALLLSKQNEEVERKNREIDQARKALEEKAEQLMLTSKYKSEFLSNMSHELRTPLNSLLILSQQLAENREGNLTEKQVAYAKTIRSSGNDLLSLINDILDLSKIESGTVTIDLAEVTIKNLCEENERTFRHIANTKDLEFTIESEKQLPNTIYTDVKRLQQIIKNLLSNAFKFTTKGSVILSIRQAVSGWNNENGSLNEADMVIGFSVSDTGIGIPSEKLKIIFEAFQQADGSTSRRFGGTGLGLSISRELANLLGGEIVVSSSPSKGSTFTLYLPIRNSKPTFSKRQSSDGLISSEVETWNDPLKKTNKEPSDGDYLNVDAVTIDKMEVAALINDDKNDINETDKVIVIIEDDPSFVQILLELAHEKGFKVILTKSGEEGINLVKQYKPVAVTLDIFLPDIEGWIVLDQLKLDPETRYIPVYVITVDDQRELSLHRGAFAHIIKPVPRKTLELILDKIINFIERKTKKLLVVEDISEDQIMIKELVGNGDVEITIASTGEDALLLLENEAFDCMILDLVLPGISGFEVIEIMHNNEKMKDTPVIVYTLKELSKAEKTNLQKYARDIIIKDVRSPVRLLDEVNLFLQRKAPNIQNNKMAMLNKFHNSDIRLDGKKALIVDDDIRNIFALTSVLERYNMEVVSAENGKDAIQILEKNRNIDFVLMDIMMPEMDGYETMSYIRKKLKMTTIPIIALTAKAMKGDREKCLQAGASDYISKPINTEQLLSLLRVWLFK